MTYETIQNTKFINQSILLETNKITLRHKAINIISALLYALAIIISISTSFEIENEKLPIKIIELPKSIVPIQCSISLKSSGPKTEILVNKYGDMQILIDENDEEILSKRIISDCLNLKIAKRQNIVFKELFMQNSLPNRLIAKESTLNNNTERCLWLKHLLSCTPTH